MSACGAIPSFRPVGKAVSFFCRQRVVPYVHEDQNSWLWMQMVSQEQMCSRGKTLFFPSGQAIVGTQKGVDWSKGLHGAAAKKLKRGSWARGLSGRGLPFAENGLGRSRTDDVRISKRYPTLYLFCSGSRQKSGESVLVVCFGQDLCGGNVHEEAREGVV